MGLRHSAHEAIRTRFERFSTPGRMRKTSWKQVLIAPCALCLTLNKSIPHYRLIHIIRRNTNPISHKTEVHFWRFLTPNMVMSSFSEIFLTAFY